MTTTSRMEEPVDAASCAVWSHWVLKTARAEQMMRWYAEVLGARVVHDSGTVAFLTWDSEHHRLALVRVPKQLLPLTWVTRAYRKFYGADHIAFTFPNLRALLELHRTLARKRIEPVWAINHGPTTSIYYEDPDGNRLEFQCNNFATVEECTTYMQGPEFRSNVIGVNFDPHYLYERMRQGVPESALLCRGAGTPPGSNSVGGTKAISWRTL